MEECKGKLGLLKDEFIGSKTRKSFESAEFNSVHSRDEPDSFDKALESVEEALLRLENLLQEMHVASFGSGKEHLKAACSDLEKIRKLKKEAEFLEASFRAKAASLQEENKHDESLSSNERRRFMKGKNKGLGAVVQDKNNRQMDPSICLAFQLQILKNRIRMKFTALNSCGVSLWSLKDEFKEVHQSENEENIYTKAVKGVELVPMQKIENLMGRSLEKLREMSTAVWQGTQLLAIDIAAATGLLQRKIIGDELTENEKKFLRRTLTDLASVVPTGILMLLPVTAVGHAAILAAIQRYVPALIPSTYGSERLDLLRQLEKMKQTDTSDASWRNVEELA